MEVFKNCHYGLGKGNYLKTRILTIVISKPTSQGMGLALSFLVLFSMAFCLYVWVGIFLMSLIQARLLYLLFWNDHEWSPETVIWWDVCLEWGLREVISQTESGSACECGWAALLKSSPGGCILTAAVVRPHCGTASRIPSFLWPLETASSGMWDEHSWC